MHFQLHLIIATSLSMIMTFILHCIMEHTLSTQSYLRLYSIDYLRDIGLYARCLFNHGITCQTCVYLITINDLFFILKNILVLCLLFVIQHYCSKIQNCIRSILFVLLTVEFLAQYVVSLSLSYKIDMITMYWFVWQFISLMLNWIKLLLLPPILIIEQGSFCMIMALMAWISHYILLRYIPLTINLLFLWFLSLLDIITCLHYTGELYDPDLAHQTFAGREKGCSDFYYTKGVDKWNKGASLGGGDFVVYNILVLFALPPSSSLITKICVTFGSIISVQIGSLLTFLLRRLAKKSSGPGIPFPVITVSVYLFILDLIIPSKLNQC